MVANSCGHQNNTERTRLQPPNLQSSYNSHLHEGVLLGRFSCYGARQLQSSHGGLVAANFPLMFLELLVGNQISIPNLTVPLQAPAPDHPVENDPDRLDELTGMIAGLRGANCGGLGTGKRNLMFDIPTGEKYQQ